MAWEDDVRKAMKMNLDDLVIWGVGNNDNSVRHKMLAFELQRRAAAAQIEAAATTKRMACYALISIVVALVSAVGGWFVSLYLTSH